MSTLSSWFAKYYQHQLSHLTWNVGNQSLFWSVEEWGIESVGRWTCMKAPPPALREYFPFIWVKQTYENANEVSRFRHNRLWGSLCVTNLMLIAIFTKFDCFLRCWASVHDTGMCIADSCEFFWSMSTRIALAIEGSWFRCGEIAIRYTRTFFRWSS